MTTTPLAGRRQPQDIDAERGVLGAMLLSRDAISDVIDLLRPTDFYRPAHQAVYEAALALYARGEPVDQITVAAELGRRGDLTRVGGAPLLVDLVDAVPAAASAGWYAKIVADKAILRRLVEAGTRAAQRAHAADTEGGDVTTVVDEAQRDVYELTRTSLSEECVRLEDLLQPALEEMETLGSRTGALLGVPTGFADLDALTNGLHAGQLVIVAARPSVGKALAVDTLLPTPEGWTSMGSVEVGDVLFDERGEPCRVVAATPVMTGRPCYRVTFSDGTVIEADADHQWLTEARSDKKGRAGRGAAARRTTAEIAATLTRDGRNNHAVRTCAPLRCPETELPIPPYTLGIWLAEGDLRNARLTLNAADAPEIEAAMAAEGTVHRRVPSGDGRGAVTVRVPGLKSALRDAGIDQRRIPPAYFRASERQRRALLAGALDGDGHCHLTGTVELIAKGEGLARDVAELACTLGYKPTCTSKRATLNGRDMGLVWRVVFTPSDIVFRVARKAARQAGRHGPRPGRRYIAAAELIPSVPVRCVQVDSPSRLYLAGRACVPTHNSTLGLDFARSAAVRQNTPSVIFSLEMARNEVVMRLLAAEARVNLQAIRTGRLTDDDWARVARRMGEVADKPLFIDDSPHVTVTQIRAKARRLRQTHGLGLLVVDYLQLMRGPGRVENRQQEVSEMSRSLKLLAKELEVPVVAISQLNRSPEQRADKRPMLSDLRESGSIEQDADVVVLLYRDDLVDGNSARQGEADLIVAKHRNGPTGTVTVAFQGQYSRFVDMQPSGGW